MKELLQISIYSVPRHTFHSTTMVMLICLIVVPTICLGLRWNLLNSQSNHSTCRLPAGSKVWTVSLTHPPKSSCSYTQGLPSNSVRFEAPVYHSNFGKSSVLSGLSPHCTTSDACVHLLSYVGRTNSTFYIDFICWYFTFILGVLVCTQILWL